MSKLELDTWMARENLRLSHMAKLDRLRDGDRNSKFFHAVINKKKHSVISKMRLPNGEMIRGPEDIH